MSKINADRGPQYAPSYPLRGLALDKNSLTEKDQFTQDIPPVGAITPTATVVAEVYGAEKVPSITTQLELMEVTKLEDDGSTDSESEGTVAIDERRHHRPLESRKKSSRKQLLQYVVTPWTPIIISCFSTNPCLLDCWRTGWLSWRRSSLT